MKAQEHVPGGFESPAKDENQFLREIQKCADLTREQAYKVMLAALHELHGRLSPEEVDELGARLPGEIKAIWFAWSGERSEVRPPDINDFARHIADIAGISEVEARRALMALFKAVQTALASPTGRGGEA